MSASRLCSVALVGAQARVTGGDLTDLCNRPWECAISVAAAQDSILEARWRGCGRTGGTRVSRPGLPFTRAPFTFVTLVLVPSLTQVRVGHAV